MGGRVLIVDEDRAGREALITCFRFVGLDAFGVARSSDANTWLDDGGADVTVLFADRPDEEDRRITDSSILLLARKPRPPLHQVVERVEAAIRERQPAPPELLTYGDLTLDRGGIVRKAGASLKLGRIDARLLAFLMTAPDRVFSREQILRQLWPSNVRVEIRTVDVHIGRLRRTLQLLKAGDWIQTVPRSGYRFSAIT